MHNQISSHPFNVAISNHVMFLSLKSPACKLIHFIALNAMMVQGDGDEDGEGGGSDIGALLGNLGPLISGLSGVSSSA